MQKIGKFLASAAFMLPLSGKISAEPTFFSVEKGHEERFHADFLLNIKHAEMPQAKSVILDIQRVEVLLHKGNTMARLRLLEGLGPVDMVNIDANLQLKIAELNIPDDVKMTQIRLVLKDGGHSLVKKNGQKCALQFTGGSDQQYVQLNKTLDFKAGLSYYVDVGMDLNNQILINQNGGCYLRPALRLTSQIEILPMGEERGEIVGQIDRTSERSPSSELMLAQWKDIFSQDIEATFGDGVY